MFLFTEEQQLGLSLCSYDMGFLQRFIQFFVEFFPTVLFAGLREREQGDWFLEHVSRKACPNFTMDVPLPFFNHTIPLFSTAGFARIALQGMVGPE